MQQRTDRPKFGVQNADLVVGTCKGKACNVETKTCREKETHRSQSAYLISVGSIEGELVLLDELCEIQFDLRVSHSSRCASNRSTGFEVS